MFFLILFWILFVLCAIGAFIPDPNYPGGPRSRWLIILILIGILGWAVFGGVDGPPKHRAELMQTHALV